MKKNSYALFAFLLCAMIAVPAMAVPIELENIEWSGSANPAAIADWIETHYAHNMDLQFITKFDDNVAWAYATVKYGSGPHPTFDPNVAWAYAVAKFVNQTKFYENNSAGVAQPTDVDNHGTSNASFYASSSAPVPEPSTILLLGSGLVGLAAFRNRFRR